MGGAAGGFVGSTVFYVAARLGICNAGLQEWAESINPLEFIARSTVDGAVSGFIAGHFGIIGGNLAANLGGAAIPRIAQGYQLLSYARMFYNVAGSPSPLCTAVATIASVAASTAVQRYAENWLNAGGEKNTGGGGETGSEEGGGKLQKTVYYHAVRDQSIAQILIENGLDEERLKNPDNRFSNATMPGLYIAENPNTTLFEVPGARSMLSLCVNRILNVLDLANPEIAAIYNYAPNAPREVTQALAARALQEGFDAIRYHSVRDPNGGINLVILSGFDQITFSPNFVNLPNNSSDNP